MTARLAHRGPDAEGFWTSPSGAACFGHRRLSVIDIEAGDQPMADRSGDQCLIFNGEIYNYVEVRDRLTRLGRRFATESDTEVLLQALREWGDDALDELIGMFAFAYWDDRRRRLVLARDRVGKKPLYHAIEGDSLYFCSTLVGLREALGSEADIDHTSVANFLDLGYVPAPDTIFRNMSKLAAATRLAFTVGDESPTVTRYWDPAGVRSGPDGIEPATDALRDLLENAVRLRLRSDVPLGVFLSGGIDSSLVAALASEISPEPVSTFTISFGVEEFDEAERARSVAAHLGTDHHEFRVEPDVLGLLPDLIRHFGEPFADATALPLWHLSRMARPEITVALLGDGGDEGFAGYDWYRTAAGLGRADALTTRPPVAAVARLLARPAGDRVRRAVSLVTAGPAERFADLRCQFGPYTTQPILRTEFEASLDESRLARDRLAGLYREALGPLRAMQYVDLRTYLADDLLPKVDVATMAHSLEARAPLLDHRVLEFAYGLPTSLQSVDAPKLLLRRLLERYVPAALTSGPKRGFTVPLGPWFREDLRPLVERLPGELGETGWFDVEGLESVVSDHVRGRRDNSERLFHLFVLKTWLGTG